MRTNKWFYNVQRMIRYSNLCNMCRQVLLLHSFQVLLREVTNIAHIRTYLNLLGNVASGLDTHSGGTNSRNGWRAQFSKRARDTIVRPQVFTPIGCDPASFTSSCPMTNQYNIMCHKAILKFNRALPSISNATKVIFFAICLSICGYERDAEMALVLLLHLVDLSLSKYFCYIEYNTWI